MSCTFHRILLAPLLSLGLFLIIGCGDDAADPAPGDQGPTMIDEARLTGLLQYLEAEDFPAPSIESEEDDTTVYVYEAADGPICMRGDEFRFSVRDMGSENLVIFLQGGGACWSDFCLAVIRAPAGVPDVDVLNMELDSNPLRDWNVVYLPYCDGAFFVGNADVDEDDDGEADRLHRGLQNLSGALRIAQERFPEPANILLTGSSAGGFGTIPASILVRAAYPDTPIAVFSDSGVGVARPGEPEFIDGLMEEFAIDELIPESCVDCTADGHILRLVEWILERDENIRMSVFSSYYDSVIADVFLKLDPVLFRDALIAETDRVAARFPDRYRRFLVDGVTHTSLLGDPSGIVGTDFGALEMSGDMSELAGVRIGSIDETAIGDVTMGHWLGAFVDATVDWVDLTDIPGEPPATSEE